MFPGGEEDAQLVLSEPADPYHGDEPDERYYSAGYRNTGYVWTFRAELTAAGLNAARTVTDSQGQGPETLGAFFEHLMANWQGWQGEQRWRSLDHDMSIAATHDGRIRLRVTLRGGYRPDSWAASGTPRLELPTDR